MTEAYAADIVAWRYPPPYDVYDMSGRERFAPAAFRVTVASFNLRALRVVEALGFRRVDSFRATTSGRSYEILTRPEEPTPGR